MACSSAKKLFDEDIRQWIIKTYYNPAKRVCLKKDQDLRSTSELTAAQLEQNASNLVDLRVTLNQQLGEITELKAQLEGLEFKYNLIVKAFNKWELPIAICLPNAKKRKHND